jgi:hypothetical protein
MESDVFAIPGSSLAHTVFSCQLRNPGSTVWDSANGWNDWNLWNDWNAYERFPPISLAAAIIDSMIFL